MRQKKRAGLEWLGGRELQDEVEEMEGGGKMGERNGEKEARELGR